MKWISIAFLAIWSFAYTLGVFKLWDAFDELYKEEQDEPKDKDV